MWVRYPVMATFSVCIPIWNGAEWIRGAVESVVAQTYPDWELVIGDNASTDDLTQRLADITDARIRVRRWDSHVQAPENFNRTMALASGEWLIPLAADDRLHPRFLERAAERIAQGGGEPPLTLVIAACRRVDPTGQLADRAWYGHGRIAQIADGTYDGDAWFMQTLQPAAIPWNFGGVALSASAIAMAGAMFRPEVGVCADMELSLRLAAYGRVAYVSEPLMDFMVHSASDGVARIRRNLAARSQPPPMSAAYLAALDVHEYRHGPNPTERRAVMAAVAREYLQRALLHRYHEGGRGRLAAMRDVSRAVASDPRTVIRPWQLAKAAAAVLAPRAVLGSATQRLANVRRDGSRRIRGIR